MQPTAKGQAPAGAESSPRRKSSGAAEIRLRQQLQASENRRLTAETTLANLMHHQVCLCPCQRAVSLFLLWTSHSNPDLVVPAVASVPFLTIESNPCKW